MTTAGHISPEDLALYAMQLVDSKDHEELHQHLQECAECRGGLSSLTGDLAILALTTDMHSPPAFARERLLRQIGREKKAAPMRPVAVSSSPKDSYAASEEEAAPRKRGAVLSFGPWLGWAAAAAMLVITVSENNHIRSLQNSAFREDGQMARLAAKADRAQQVLDLLQDQGATRVSLTKGGAAPAPIGRATYSPKTGALVFLASNMEPLPPYKAYELWVIPANGHDPIPAGTFQPDAKGNASVMMPDIPKDVEAKAFGITIEDQGGSQTPTLPIVMSGS